MKFNYSELCRSTAVHHRGTAFAFARYSRVRCSARAVATRSLNATAESHLDDRSCVSGIRDWKRKYIRTATASTMIYIVCDGNGRILRGNADFELRDLPTRSETENPLIARLSSIITMRLETTTDRRTTLSRVCPYLKRISCRRASLLPDNFTAIKLVLARDVALLGYF